MSGDIAIRVQNLSKLYRIGRRQPYRTFRETITELVTAPLRSRHRSREDEEGRTFWALRDIDIDIPRGSVVGIIGRNGAGKSTLLKVLSRITEPTSGRIEITGRVGSLLEVGTGFHPELTGRENVYLNGSILGMRRAEIESKFDQIVAFAEVEKFLDTPVKHFSSGMYTRLAFAVAAHLEPEILIVDEVLAVGDAQFQRKCMGRMGEVAREGRTVLFVSHNLSAVRDLCSRVAWLDGGRLHAVGETASVTDRYMAESMSGGSTSRMRTAQCELLSADCLNAAGQPAAVIDSRTQWGARVRYRFFEPLRGGATLRVTSAGGVVIFEAHEFIRGADERAPGEYMTSFDLSGVSLAPGGYYLSVYLMAHHVGVYLVAEQCAQFTVSGTLRGYGGSVAPFDITGVLLVEPPIKTIRIDTV